MLLPLIALFTLVPFLELALLFRAAEAFGGAETLLLCLVTGVVGGPLAQRQGAAVVANLRRELGQGRVPGGALLEAFLVFGGGLLLLTPGILTDVVGFAAVLPPSRRWLAGRLAARMQAAVLGGGPGGGGFGVHVVDARFTARDPDPAPPETIRVIDG